VTEHLIADLDAPSWRARHQAAQALGRAGAVEALPALLRRVKVEEHSAARAAALIALGRLGGPQARRVLERELLADAPGATLAARSLGLMGAAGIEPLARAIHEGAYPVQVRAALALSRLSLPETVPVWRRVLAERPAGIRAIAVQALEDIEAPEAVHALCQAARNPWRRVAVAARRALENLSDPRRAANSRVVRLCALLECGDTALRLRAAAALERLVETQPHAALRAALDPLGRLCGLFATEPQEARATFRALRDRIAREAPDTGALPIPAERRPQDVGDLPLPGGTPEEGGGDLPRAAGRPRG